VKSRWLIFVLLMSVTLAFAAEQPAADQNLRIIQMDGHGEARANPDQAVVSFAIETKGSTAREAGTQNAQIATKVIAALKSKVAARGQGRDWRLRVDAVVWRRFSAVRKQDSRLGR